MDDDSRYVILRVKLPRKLVTRFDKIVRRLGAKRGRILASLIADWIQDYVDERFQQFSMRYDVVNIIDRLLEEIVTVKVVRDELFCEYCKSFTCGHAKYARKIYIRKRSRKVEGE